ncbi:hypothetical protein B0H12DRAFT_1228648 [Mycena haematopus]|nr:hypothetical protein B0H12DRAFT_1228648 [Mycena haematopus]
MSSASTTSLMSNTTVSSRAPLNGPRTVQPKDFQAAFASLQSTYGFNGSAPNPVQKKKTSSSPSRPAVSSESSRAPSAKKDFQSAFADLQSTYGFGGAAPSPIPKSKNGKW